MKAIIFFLIIFPFISSAQSIIYSQPDNQDTLSNDFGIIGKVNNNFLIYKYDNNSLVYKFGKVNNNFLVYKNRNNSLAYKYSTTNLLLVYNNDMELLNRKILDFLPSENIASINFIPYSQFCLVIFQALENNVMYCKAAKMDETGKLIGEVKTIDSTKNNIFNGGESYIISYSENKKYILLNRTLWGLKENKLQMDQILIDEDLTIKKNDSYFIPFLLGRNFISDASVDNAGNIIFITWTTIKNKKSDLTVYKSTSDSSDLIIKNISINQYELQRPAIKINNEENIYCLVSFYKNLTGYTEGLISMTLKSDLSDNTQPQISAMSTSVKYSADESASPNFSLSHYLLSDFIFKKNGDFFVAGTLHRRNRRFPEGKISQNPISSYDPSLLSESIFDSRTYETGSGRIVERSYLPGLGSYGNLPGNNSPPKPMENYPNSNVITFSFSRNNQLFATNVLHQFLPLAALSFYTTMVLDKQMVFIYNNIDKKHHATLSNFSIRTDGSTMLNPAFKNYDPQYSFYPEFGKQVDAKTMIMPCTKNNQLVMAKITFD